MARSVPRSAFAKWTPPADRDPEAVLARQERTRLPELLPIRHARMRVSPFGFYRGATAIMVADLATLPLTGLRVQACGDAHLLNFGAYALPERNLVFDVNDFDETLEGPWEWDVLRLATSVELVARGSAFGKVRANEAVLATVEAYREAMARFAAVSPLDVWYAHIQLQNAPAPATPRAAEQLMPKLTANDRPRFVDQPPLFTCIALDGAESRTAKDILATYRETLPSHVQVLLDRFQLHDLAQKVVGVGSVGTRCFVALLLTDRGESLLLQLKEADASVLEPFAGASRYTHHGRRVVEGQHLVQAASDIFLGWTTSEGVDYYVRQLRDMKTTAPVARMAPRELIRYARSCAWTLAHAHARSGDPRALAAYLGKSDAFDASVAAFAVTYADVTDADYREFCRRHPAEAAG
jgi:uncharacterized protein (DUF2252 family)